MGSRLRRAVWRWLDLMEYFSYCEGCDERSSCGEIDSGGDGSSNDGVIIIVKDEEEEIDERHERL